MRIFPFLVILICVCILSCYLITVFSLKAETQTITVTARVLEHLTYQKYNQEIIVSTNVQSDFMFINLGDQVFQSFSGPSEQEIIFPVDSFILVANF